MSSNTSLWTQWERRYESYAMKLTKDGAGDDYYVSTPRVLVVLKEPNKSPGEDLRWILNSGAKYQIWHTVAVWVAGILNGFPPYAELRYDSARKNAALRRVAAMNLKKTSGGATIDDRTLHWHSFQERALLRQQIKELGPTVILACGTFEPLLWLLDDRIPDSAKPDDSVLALDGGAKLVCWRHPARSRGENDYNILRDRLSPQQHHAS